MSYKISKVDANTIYMDASFARLKLNGKDRTKDLRATVGSQTVTMPWTIYSHRTGVMSPLHMNPVKQDIMPILSEAGIYLAFFEKQPVKIGDSWEGSVTATGGCTSGTFTLRKVRAEHHTQLADFEITHIMFIDSADEQVGPMRMTVDLSTGLPTTVEYAVKNSKTNRMTRIRQMCV